MSFSLLNLAIGAVLSMHGFNHGGNIISLGLIITVFGMGLWFRDIVMEGTWRRATSYINLYFLYVCESVFIVVAQAYLYLTLFLLTITNNNKESLYNLITTRVLPDQDVKQALNIYKSKSNSYSVYVNNSDNFGYYLAGLLEGRSTQQQQPVLRSEVGFNWVTFTKLNENIVAEEKTKVNSIIKKSRNMKYITDDLDKLPLPLNDIIIGLLLGDLHASKGSLKNTRLIFEQGDIHSDYLFHLYDLFKNFCKTEPKITKRFDKRTNKFYTRIKFSTLSSPLFNYYLDLFYVNNIKIIPANLGEILTARSLAYWAMDDGSKTGTGFRLNTQSYTKVENLLLIQILKDKFDLDCSLHLSGNNQQRIYIKTRSMLKFKDLVSPYFHESMMYKLTEVKDSSENKS